MADAAFTIRIPSTKRRQHTLRKAIPNTETWSPHRHTTRKSARHMGNTTRHARPRSHLSYIDANSEADYVTWPCRSSPQWPQPPMSTACAVLREYDFTPRDEDTARAETNRYPHNKTTASPPWGTSTQAPHLSSSDAMLYMKNFTCNGPHRILPLYTSALAALPHLHHEKLRSTCRRTTSIISSTLTRSSYYLIHQPTLFI